MVHKYDIKIDGPTDDGDDTGLSYIWMECKQSDKELRGGFVFWGYYNGTTQQCPNYMVGFQLQMCNENVGATNMVMYCSHDESDYKTANSWGNSEGPCNWGPKQFCPQNYAVCGFQYQYEPQQGSDVDDSAITNVKMLCCRVP